MRDLPPYITANRPRTRRVLWTFADETYNHPKLAERQNDAPVCAHGIGADVRRLPGRCQKQPRSCGHTKAGAESHPRAEGPTEKCPPSLCLCRNARPGHVSASARYSHSSISYDYFCVEEQRLKFRLGCANKVSMPPRWVHEHKQKHNSIHEQLSHTSQNYVLFFAR